MLERGPGGEAHPKNPPPRPLSFPHPRQCVPPDGDWQLQAPPGAPGTARQGPTRIIMLVNDGGTATQPKAPGHDRPFTASAGAAKHGRLSAAPRAPGADIPLATTAGAPGQYRLRAALLAPGHERPHAALPAAWRDRPRAAPRAPGADVPPATTAEAPGQYRLRAALLAPGHERPRAALCAARPGRPRAAPRAPGADVPPATTAEAPGQYRLRAVAYATVALPAGQRRLRQVSLPRIPANPRILTHSPAHQDTADHHTDYSQAALSLCIAGGLPGGQPLLPSPNVGEGPGVRPISPSPGACSGGGLGRGQRLAHPTTHQGHPAIQVPPHPRPCSTAAKGFPRQHPSRAPPPRHCGGSRNPAAQLHSAGVLPGSVVSALARYPLSKCWRGAGGEDHMLLTTGHCYGHSGVNSKRGCQYASDGSVGPLPRRGPPPAVS